MGLGWGCQQHGTQCMHCLKHIETDKTFSILLTIALILIMLRDFQYYKIGYTGFTCCFLLFVFGGPMKWSHSNFIPLRYYGNV